MTKDEALKLALEALEAEPFEMVEDAEGHMVFLTNQAITAIRQALAAPVEPDWKAEYLKSVESGCITLDELREANAELEATNRQVEILSDALAESRREIDALVALARADERGRMCEQLKECSSEKPTSNEANRSAVLGEGGQANCHRVLGVEKRNSR